MKFRKLFSSCNGDTPSKSIYIYVTLYNRYVFSTEYSPMTRRRLSTLKGVPERVIETIVLQRSPGQSLGMIGDGPHCLSIFS